MRALIVVVLLAATAHADPRAIAEKNFRAGAAAYKAQNFEAAAQDFDAAFEAMPAPEIAFSAAQAHRRWYHIKHLPADIARAVELYRFYLSKVSTGGRVRDAEDAIAELRRDYDELAAAGKLGKAAQISVTRIGIAVTFADQTERRAMKEIDDASGASSVATEAQATINDKPAMPNAYTPVEYRGLGVMSAAMAEIAERAADMGAHEVIAFVDDRNLLSLKGCQRAGFHPYMLHRRIQIVFGLVVRNKFEEFAENDPRRSLRF